MMWGSDYWTGWGSGMGNEQRIMMLVFWVLIIVGMVIIFRRFSGSNKAKFSDRLTTPIDILKSRCAGRDQQGDEYGRLKEDR